MKLRALRSSYGDLGRVRRNQIVQVDDNLGKKLLASKLYTTDLAVSEPAPTPTDHSTDLSKMTVDQLKAFAADKNIDLGEASKKADIVTAIQLALEPGD